MGARRRLRNFSGAIVLIAVVTAYPAVRRLPGSQTQIVLLGTGAVGADPQRSGPATAIVVNDTPYIVDAGPGIVRRAAGTFNKGVKGLAVEKLQTAFITHLHVDHTVAYPDLILTPWVSGRNTPLRVYGPTGLEAMTKAILVAWQADIDIQTKGLEQRRPAGIGVDVHEIKPGAIYEGANVKVIAFPVLHGDWPEAFGYRFQTPDRTVVISGDTTPSPGMIDNCQKCDVLIHEAYSEEYLPPAVPNWCEYRSKYHTTTTQLAEIANKTQPRLLIVYHRGVLLPGREISDEEYFTEIRRTCHGKVIIGQDSDVY